MKYILLFVCALICVPAFANEEALFVPKDGLDQPTKVDHVELRPSTDFPIDAETPPGHGDVACSYYEHIMVKQIDIGEKGAALLSWTNLSGKYKKPVCEQESTKGEYVVPPDIWSGYFESAVGPYLYFTADDGTSGGMGFAIFHAQSHKKLLEDTAIGSVATTKQGKDAIKLKYKRAYHGPCSMLLEGKSCWDKITHETGIIAIMPDCADEYLKREGDMAHARCQGTNSDNQTCYENQMKILDAQGWNQAPSMIGYNVEATVTASASTIKPVGGDVVCYPSD